MVFSSPVFVFCFLPVTLALYYAVQPRLRNAVLMLCSLFFYAWGEPVNVLVMLASIALNYALGRALEKAGGGLRLSLLLVAVLADLGVLFYYKYENFFFDTLNLFTPLDIEVARVALPIGISFYTFQILSYVVDVYRGQVKAQRSFVDLALYISLFPQLIAGPIVRYTDIERQLPSRPFEEDRFYAGLLRFMKGFAKKVLLADRLAPLADAAFANIGASALLSWAGIAAYTLQIYYDFSGYSDMAIGLGRLFGFEFMENFNFPYISKSVREFWRRWHISLSTWFRDYVYIPLGGSRRGRGRTYVNLAVVFFLTGLWHGAGMNFIAWGLYYGAFLILERVWLGRALEKLGPVVGHAYTLAVVMAGWVFFRADSLTQAVAYLSSMVTGTASDWAGLLTRMKGDDLFCLAAGALLACPHPRVRALLEKRAAGRMLKGAALLLLFILALCYMTGSGFTAFLYFRF